MALDNLISLSLSATDLKRIDEAIANLKSVFSRKTINLTPEQRRQYGSIAEQNKLFVNKAKQYMEQFTAHVPAFIGKREFDSDYTAREQIGQRLDLLASIVEELSDTKILLDHDNFQNALSFYRNIRYLASENVPGTNAIYDDMKQFFTAANTPSQPTPPSSDEAL